MAIVNGTGGADTLFGTQSDDEMNGLGGNDWLQALSGNDTLDGGQGNDALWAGNESFDADTMTGGKGNDTYHISSAGDLVNELAAEGTDRVHAYIDVDFSLDPMFADIENMRLVGFSTGLDGRGNDLDNTLEGNREFNSLAGGNGSDVIIVHSTIDIADGEADSDTVLVDFSANLATTANWISIENITLAEGKANLNATGDGGDNVLTGNDGKNTLTGGAGNDTYVLKSTSVADVIKELPGGGNDTVSADFTYTLASRPDIENITLTGTSAVNATGNAAVNILTGNDGGNSLNGLGGADTMVGGKGNDTYFVDTLGEVVTEAAGEGTDKVNSSIDWILVEEENLTLTGLLNIDGTGNASNNTIIGNAGVNTLEGKGGNDYLDGGAGADYMRGDVGDNTYVVNLLTDVVDDGLNGGLDTVNATLAGGTYVMTAGIEVLNLLGTAACNAVGNASDNTITGNAAANVITGGDGFDIINAGNGNNNVDGGNDDDTITTGSGTDIINGGNGLDTLNGGNGNNVLNGGGEVDTLTTGSGTDILNGGDGNDTLNGGFGRDTLNGDDGDDVLHGGDGDDILVGGDADFGADFLDGGGGRDIMRGGLGNDGYGYDNTADVIIELAGEGNDTVYSFLDYVLANPTTNFNVENLSLDPVTPAGVHGTAVFGTGNSLDNDIEGGLVSNVLRGGGGNDYLHDPLFPNSNGGKDSLDGGTGVDTMQGFLDDDTYFVDDAGDTVIEAVLEGLNDHIYASVTYDMGVSATGEVERLTLTGTAAINGTGNAIANTITGNAGINTLTGGDGDDIFFVGAGDDVRENAGEGTLDTVMAATTWVLASNLDTLHEVEGLTLVGTGAINGTGNELDNRLKGNAAANTLAGGLGNDTYVIDDTNDVALDVLRELTGEGSDTVEASISYSLALAPPTLEIENITLVGALNINAVGNGLDNVLTGNDGNNTLDGSVGVDTLVGGKGNDTLVVDSLAEVVTELAGEGTDIVLSGVDFDLSVDGVEVENLTLTGANPLAGTGNILGNIITGNGNDNALDGGDGADMLFGNFGTDTLIGGVVGDGADADTLDGGNGADLMTGSDGDDLYIVDNVLDVITELAGEGEDQVNAAIIAGDTYVLSADVDHLTLLGAVNSNGTGNAIDNSLTGNAGVNTLAGLAGNDTYVVTAGDEVLENAGEGADTIMSAISWVLAAVDATHEIEALTLTGAAIINGTGNALANTITGNSAANTLDGLTGADSLVGLGGNDTYVVDNVLDIVDETGGGGVDTVRASVDYDMSAQSISAVDNLTLLGAALVGIGNAFNNVITGNAGVNTLAGNAGNDTLIGGAGADTMTGGVGNDTFNVDNTGDVVIEGASGGVDTLDTVMTGVNFVLGAAEEVEIITLTGTSAINVTGSNTGNTITGNSAINTLLGLDGDDTFVVAANDIIDGGNGSDTAKVAFSANLSALGLLNWTSIENITLTGKTLLNATGDAGVNTLTGNEVKNTLNGISGADTLIGGLGDDLYIVGDALANLDEDTLGGGKDQVNATVSYSLDQATSQTVENLTLIGPLALNGTGNASNNIIKGNAFNNVLNGLAGADTMDGGAGNDSYFVDNLGDLIKDAGGIDNVTSTNFFYTLATGMENLQLGGVSNINGTGNTVANTITGNSGKNSISGGTGIDTMIGGLEDDIYVVDNIGEQAAGKIVELAGQGDDTIRTAITFSMVNHANVENLTLTGTGGIHGTGNSENNTLTGNTGANSLSGGAGDDTLIGGAGKDTLFGGADDDIFYFNSASIFSTADVIKDFGVGADSLFFELDIDPLMDVYEDFVEHKFVGANTQVWVDFDGVGTDFTAKLAVIIEGVLVPN